MLYGVRPKDPPDHSARGRESGAGGPVGYALLAAVVPARKATHIDPMGSLRNE